MITTAVRPASASPSAACTAAFDVESRCAVASSRITTRGRVQQQPKRSSIAAARLYGIMEDGELAYVEELALCGLPKS
ncbi:MAG: hypothetical protein ACRDUV_09275 [Pseudonocardiaceae bacterium]